MCGRFTLTTGDLDEVAGALEAELAPAAAALARPRYNIAPSDAHPILRARGGRRQIVPATWGFFADGAAAQAGIINARAESAADKPRFRDAFQLGRCVIPADGFFEWRGPRTARQPLWFHRADGGLIYMAGLVEARAAPGAPDEALAFVILTTAANQRIAAVHDRMPALLPADAIAAWLARPDPELLQPAPEALLIGTEVSERVNSAENDDPACLEPPTGPRQLTLL